MTGSFAWGPPEIASLQVRELSYLISERLESSDKEVRQRDDLREREGMPRKRHEITDPAELHKKHSIEAGFNWLTGQMLPAPLEEWTGPPGSEEKYGELMRGTAPRRLQDWHGADLPIAEWLLAEELAGLKPGPDGREIVPLSDAQSRGQRKYPGAPVGDKQAGIGKILGDKLPEMAAAAVIRLARGKSLQRRGGKLQVVDGKAGYAITARMVAVEVNTEKSRRADLAEYRYAGLSRIYEVLRKVMLKLIAAGIIQLLRKATPVRRKRSWFTLARVARLVMATREPVPLLPGPPFSPRERGAQRPPVIHARRIPHLHLVHAPQRRQRARAPRVQARRDPRPQVARPRALACPDAVLRRLTRRHCGAPAGAPPARRSPPGTCRARSRSSRSRGSGTRPAAAP